MVPQRGKTQVCVSHSSNEYQCLGYVRIITTVLFGCTRQHLSARRGSTKKRLQSVTHFLFLTSPRCHPPSESAHSQTHICPHSTVALDVLALAERLPTPAVRRCVSTVSPRPCAPRSSSSKTLSHVSKCDSARRRTCSASSASALQETGAHIIKELSAQ